MDEGIAGVPSSVNTDSDRVLVTKRAVFEALCELAEERDFGSITVGDIVKRAGVSRSTFYRYFEDKYDVVNWSYKRYKNIRLRDSDKRGYEAGLLSHLLHLRDHRACYSGALRYKGQNSLRDSMYETNEEYMLDCWQSAQGSGKTSYNDLCAVRVAAAGSTKIIERWVLEGFVEAPEDVVAAIVGNIPRNVLGTLL